VLRLLASLLSRITSLLKTRLTSAGVIMEVQLQQFCAQLLVMVK
jgi:hypothetical protein